MGVGGEEKETYSMANGNVCIYGEIEALNEWAKWSDVLDWCSGQHYHEVLEVACVWMFLMIVYCFPAVLSLPLQWQLKLQLSVHSVYG